MTVSASVDKKEFEQVVVALNKVINMDNSLSLYDTIGARFESRVQQRFSTKKDPDGNPWKPWAPSTQAIREAEGRGTLLVYEGNMSRGLTYNPSSSGVEVGFNVLYADDIEFGRKGTEGRGPKMPARHMLLSANGGLAEKDVSAITRAITKYFFNDNLKNDLFD